MSRRTGGSLTEIMGRLVGPTVMTWLDDDGLYHAEVTTDAGITRAKAYARGAIADLLGTRGYQQVLQEQDSRTTETTTYWVES